MPPPPIVDGEGNVFSGRSVGRPSVVHLACCYICLLSREISTKLATNIHHARERKNWFSGSAVEGQGHSETQCIFFRRRHTFRQRVDKAHLFLQSIHGNCSSKKADAATLMDAFDDDLQRVVLLVVIVHAVPQCLLSLYTQFISCPPAIMCEVGIVSIDVCSYVRLRVSVCLSLFVQTLRNYRWDVNVTRQQYVLRKIPEVITDIF